jgi:hypothetical protein
MFFNKVESFMNFYFLNLIVDWLNLKVLAEIK